MDYIAYLHKDENSDYGVSFPDFPGCITAGATLDEARRMAVEALEFHIEGMIENGEAIPAPSSLDNLAKDEALKDAVAFLVSITPPGKQVRVNISVREDQLALIDQAAREAGMTRSAFMVQGSFALSSQLAPFGQGSRKRTPTLFERITGTVQEHLEGLSEEADNEFTQNMGQPQKPSAGSGRKRV